MCFAYYIMVFAGPNRYKYYVHYNPYDDEFRNVEAKMGGSIASEIVVLSNAFCALGPWITYPVT